MFNGMEIGIVVTILAKILMDLSRFWPYDTINIEEETLEESLILASLCERCNIDPAMPKMQKLEKIHAHLLALLEIRKVLED